MGFTVLTQENGPDDFVRRMQAAHARRVDPSDVYKTVQVTVEHGPKNEKGVRARSPITLRYAMDAPYLFAVFGDNQTWADLDRDEWDAAAKNAIEKFCAVRNLQIKFGPRPEDGNRYNWMCETSRVIEYQESTVAAMQQERERKEREAADQQRAIGR
jgi:hypothetical protein